MKRELRVLQEYLEEAAESGQLNESVYLNACKKIKNVFDASETRKELIMEEVVIDYALHNPFSLLAAPVEINVFEEDFVENLFDIYSRIYETDAERTEWLSKICDVYFDPNDMPASYIDIAAEIAITMIEIMPECTEVVMDRLTDEIDIDATDLFSVEMVKFLALKAPVLVTYFFVDGECIADESWAKPEQIAQLRNALEEYEKKGKN